MRLLLIYIHYIARILLFCIYLAFFVCLFYVLDKECIRFQSTSLLNPLYDFFKDLDPIIYVVIIFSIVFVCTTVIEFFLTYITFVVEKAKNHRSKIIHKYINEKLFDYLTRKTNVEDDKLFIKRLKWKYRTDRPRSIFINRLRRIMMLSTGEIHDKCIQLFQFMNVNAMIESNLYSPFLKHKLFAIDIIGDFKMYEYVGKVKAITKHKNRALASTAIISYLKLNRKSDLSFLTRIKQSISCFDFFNIVIIAKDSKTIDYKTLIENKFPVVSALGIRLASMHNKSELKFLIQERLTSDHDFLRDEAQKAFISMLEKDDLSIVIKRFDDLTSSNQKNMLTALVHYLTVQPVFELFERVIEHYEFELKLTAISAIIKYRTFDALRFRNHENALVRKAYLQSTDISSW